MLRFSRTDSTDDGGAAAHHEVWRRGPVPHRMALSCSALTAAIAMLAMLAVVGSVGSQEPGSETGSPRGVAARPLATQPAATTQPARAENPHWRSTGCRACHAYVDDKLQPIAMEQIDPVCWSCHDGQRAHREVHPVGRLFIEGQVIKPEGWPVPDDKLACVTCHDIRSACDHAEARPTINSAFLRGTPGESPRRFCGHCHASTDHAQRRYSPHIMLDGQGRPLETVCTFCHQTTTSAAGAMVRTGEADLRADPVGLCVVCHPRHVDYFEPGHIGHPLPAEMRERLVRLHAAKEARESAVPQTQPADAALFLPLAEDGRIVCATCHNPHQEGLFPAGSTLGEGAMDPDGHDKRMRLRGLGKDVCRACHDK